MIVFRDTTECGHLRLPQWSGRFASAQIKGVTYFCHAHFAKMLCARDDVEWCPAGDGYECAVYGRPDMRLYLDDQNGVLQCAELVDISGITCVFT